ncbi:porin [Paraburkholderia acidisoli]|uniref:Porin n=1 Tax=Paraburkholderia acidisoli TaxID=2571748 RepID=A0A7Z2JFE6_9BURK|nr:porin [Paraburkholderia acidisoli]QGZ63352.1 porin [Paraburkholderia acidisoli]
MSAALAGTAVFGMNCAFAQSSVTLYGIVDTGLMYVNNQHGASNWEMTSGKLSGSRFGLRGEEDLGGGYQALFVLENGFSGPTGALQQGSRLFGRQAYVGVSGKSLGRLTLGRQYSPYELYVGYLSAGIRWGTSLMTDPFDLNMLGGSVRFNNAVTYESPDYYGLTYSVQYAFSNQAASEAGQGFANNREFGAALKYQHGGLRAAIGYANLSAPNAASNTSGATYGDYPGAFPLWFKQLDSNASGASSSATVAIGKQQVLAGGFLYKPGALAFGAVASRTWIGGMTIAGAKTPGFNTSAGRFDINSFELSSSYDLSVADTLGVMAKYSNAELRTGAGTTPLHWWQFGVGNDYLFSKRTDVYFAAAYEIASGSHNVAQITLDAPSSNSTQIAVTVGLRHRF